VRDPPHTIAQVLPIDHAGAVRLFAEASARGDATAQFRLGMCYLDGVGTEKREQVRTAHVGVITPTLTPTRTGRDPADRVRGKQTPGGCPVPARVDARCRLRVHIWCWRSPCVVHSHVPRE
jgi:hypothetical protein